MNPVGHGSGPLPRGLKDNGNPPFGNVEGRASTVRWSLGSLRRGSGPQRNALFGGNVNRSARRRMPSLQLGGEGIYSTNPPTWCVRAARNRICRMSDPGRPRRVRRQLAGSGPYKRNRSGVAKPLRGDTRTRSSEKARVMPRDSSPLSGRGRLAAKGSGEARRGEARRVM